MTYTKYINSIVCFNSSFRSKKTIDPFYQFWEELSAEDLENLKKPIKRVIFSDQNAVQLLPNLYQLLLFRIFFFISRCKYTKHLRETVLEIRTLQGFDPSLL